MVFLFRQFYYRYEQFFSFVSDQSDVGRHLTAVGRLSDKKYKSFILITCTTEHQALCNNFNFLDLHLTANNSLKKNELKFVFECRKQLANI